MNFSDKFKNTNEFEDNGFMNLPEEEEESMNFEKQKEDFLNQTAEVQVKMFLKMDEMLKANGFEDKEERYHIIEIIF